MEQCHYNHVFLILVTVEFLQQKAHYPLTKEPENYDFISYYYIQVKWG